MAYPRYLHVPPDAPGTYHCISRCVRRAFLCGADVNTGQSFDHRKQWLEERIITLARIFAVGVHAYAVMSNHFHIVIETDPRAPWQWSDVEVASRWLSLSAPETDSESALATRTAALTAQPERLEVLRQRLSSLSWYMRYLKEPIARQANREDGCTGRFWEGRFRTQALLDDTAVLAVMAYVDLNPVRAGISATAEQSEHTSAKRRAHDTRSLDQALRPIATSIDTRLTRMTNAQYLQLIDWTGQELHVQKKARHANEAPSTIARIGMRPNQWLIQVPATESKYWRVIGRAESMLAHAQQTGMRWLRGIGTARSLARLADVATS